MFLLQIRWFFQYESFLKTTTRDDDPKKPFPEGGTFCHLPRRAINLRGAIQHFRRLQWLRPGVERSAFALLVGLRWGELARDTIRRGDMENGSEGDQQPRQEFVSRRKKGKIYSCSFEWVFILKGSFYSFCTEGHEVRKSAALAKRKPLDLAVISMVMMLLSS